jgi:cbb3-type cytochrome oxidase subunit 3
MKGRLLAEIYQATPLTAIGLILFFLAFLGVVGWVYLRKGAAREYEALSRLPLSKEGES